LEITIKSEGEIEVKGKRWNVDKLKTVTIIFDGHLTSTYTYPITSTDLIKQIILKIEE